MTLAATTKKLKVRFYEYVRDRILKKNVIPPLSELIHNATHELLRTQSFSLTGPLIIEMIPTKLAKNAKKPLNLCELRALRGGIGSFARIHV